jgi:hypothetical protein
MARIDELLLRLPTYVRTTTYQLKCSGDSFIGEKSAEKFETFVKCYRIS